MAVSDKTILVNRNVDEGENTQAVMILNEVYGALKDAGHNPTVQLVGILCPVSLLISRANMMRGSLLPEWNVMSW